MIEVKEMLRLWLEGRGFRAVARLSGTDRKRCAGMWIGRGRVGWTVMATSVS